MVMVLLPQPRTVMKDDDDDCRGDDDDGDKGKNVETWRNRQRYPLAHNEDFCFREVIRCFV